MTSVWFAELTSDVGLLEISLFSNQFKIQKQMETVVPSFFKSFRERSSNEPPKTVWHSFVSDWTVKLETLTLINAFFSLDCERYFGNFHVSKCLATGVTSELKQKIENRKANARGFLNLTPAVQFDELIKRWSFLWEANKRRPFAAFITAFEKCFRALKINLTLLLRLPVPAEENRLLWLIFLSGCWMGLSQFAVFAERVN